MASLTLTSQQAAYQETTVESNGICQRMHSDRRALFAQNIDERAPCQHSMETGMRHFNQHVRHQLQQHITQAGVII